MGPRQEHFQMLALYNRWANEHLYDCAAQLTPEALAEDRGTFFGSLLGTLNHLLVTDRLWMSRLEGVRPLAGSEDHRIRPPSVSRNPSTTPRPAAHRILNPSIRCSLICSTNYQTHHRRQAHHLIGLALGREKVPVLGLLVYQRSAAGGLLMRRRKKRSCQPRSTVSLPVRRTELHS